ncbi:MAG: hypothetical protein ACOH2V_01255 [Candidatus Saccharimonadaceae bacterium]
MPDDVFGKTNGHFQNAQNKVAQLLSRGSGVEFNNDDKVIIQKVVQQLKHIAAKQERGAKAEAERTAAIKELSGISERLKFHAITLKTGGVLKAQSGTYLAKYAKPLENGRMPTQPGTTAPKSTDISEM